MHVSAGGWVSVSLCGWDGCNGTYSQQSVILRINTDRVGVGRDREPMCPFSLGQKVEFSIFCGGQIKSRS
jgi:hypothetical protein